MNISGKNFAAMMTLLSFVLYIFTDIIELIQSGFSGIQLILTYSAMAGAAIFLPLAGYSCSASLRIIYNVSIFLISLSFVFFSGTAVYAFGGTVSDYGAVISGLGTIYYAHGVFLTVGCFLLSFVLFKDGKLVKAVPLLFLLSSVIAASAGIAGLHENYYIAANFIRNTAFAVFSFKMITRNSLPDNIS